MLMEMMKMLRRWRRWGRTTSLLKDGLSMWDKMFRGRVAVEEANATCYHEHQT